MSWTVSPPAPHSPYSSTLLSSRVGASTLETERSRGATNLLSPLLPSCFSLTNEAASSLTAVELAVRALRRNEIDIALVGAVELTGDVRAALALSLSQPWAPDHESKPLSREANGVVLGEGAAAIVLRRCSDQPHGDPQGCRSGFTSVRFSVTKPKRYKLCLCKATKKPPFCDSSHCGL